MSLTLLAVLTSMAIPSGPMGVVGCSHMSHGHCVGFWWYAHGGPDVYNYTTGQVIPDYAYIDDTTPCNTNEPPPMNTVTAPVGSVPCEQLWVIYYHARYSTVWAASAGKARFSNAIALQEWYPHFGRPLTVKCGFPGYIVQRYFGSHKQYSKFNHLWRSAARCHSTQVLAYY